MQFRRSQGNFHSTCSQIREEEFQFWLCGLGSVLFYVIARGKPQFCLFQYFRGRFLNPFNAYKAVVVYYIIAVLVNAKSVLFLSCHPVYVPTSSYYEQLRLAAAALNNSIQAVETRNGRKMSGEKQKRFLTYLGFAEYLRTAAVSSIFQFSFFPFSQYVFTLLIV